MDRGVVPSIGTYYFGSVGPNDWTTPQNGNLWQNGSKTLFDPCPAGWRVPKGGAGELSPWNTFTADNGQWENTGPAAGCRWNVPQIFGGEACYGMVGWRHFISGNFGNVGTEGTYWSSFHAGYLMIWTMTINLDRHSGRAHAFSVRCLRE